MIKSSGTVKDGDISFLVTALQRVGQREEALKILNGALSKDPSELHSDGRTYSFLLAENKSLLAAKVSLDDVEGQTLTTEDIDIDDIPAQLQYCQTLLDSNNALAAKERLDLLLQENDDCAPLHYALGEANAALLDAERPQLPATDVEDRITVLNSDVA